MPFTIPITNAAESTIQPTTETKSLSILTSVCGFNITQYSNIVIPNAPPTSIATLPQTETNLILSIGVDQARARLTFASDRLHQIYITEVKNATFPASIQVSDIKGDAARFLQQYSTYTNDPMYKQLSSELTSIASNANITKTFDNMQLRTIAYGHGSQDFIWTYVDGNGVTAPLKDIVISYRDGAFKSFFDNWYLYKVAGYPAVPKSEAITIALNAIGQQSWDVLNSDNKTVSVSNFKVASVGNTSLCYMNYIKDDLIRGGDPLVLYPAWYVPLGFDKIYGGSITGAYVGIWADTGTVSSVTTMESGPTSTQSAVPKTTSNQESMVSVPIGIVVALAFTVLLFVRVRNLLFSGRLGRLPLRIFISLFCFVAAFSLLTSAIPKVEGSNSAGVFGCYIGQTTNEQAGISDAVDVVAYEFYNAGYDVSDQCGTISGTSLLSTVTGLEYYHDFVAWLYIGHMAGSNAYWTSMFNTTANNINSMTTGDTHFAWSWVCRSTGYDAYNGSLATAWTHNQLNDGTHCYIGFDGASPTLTGYCFHNAPGASSVDFISLTYYYALSQSYTIANALDSASWDVFGEPYDSCPLQLYYTYWPIDYGPGMGPGWYLGKMVKDGNWNICL